MMKHLLLDAAALALAAPALAQNDRSAGKAPPLIEQIENGNWLPESEAIALRDELYYQRAFHAHMAMIPALNTIGMRDGSEAAFGAGSKSQMTWSKSTKET